MNSSPTRSPHPRRATLKLPANFVLRSASNCILADARIDRLTPNDYSKFLVVMFRKFFNRKKFTRLQILTEIANTEIQHGA
jgi:hypothetical protein